MIEGSLVVKLPTIWTVGKAEVGRVREEKRRRKKIREEKVRRKKRHVRKGRKVAIHSISPMICGSGGSESRLAKAAGAEPCRQMRNENCTPLWRKARVQVKMYKTPQLRRTLRSCDVEKVHAIVVRSKFPSQNVQNTPTLDHFWKFRCRKSARHCGAKHISKSKV